MCEEGLMQKRLQLEYVPYKFILNLLLVDNPIPPGTEEKTVQSVHRPPAASTAPAQNQVSWLPGHRSGQLVTCSGQLVIWSGAWPTLLVTQRILNDL
jgi:hypothetical protein